MPQAAQSVYQVITLQLSTYHYMRIEYYHRSGYLEPFAKGVFIAQDAIRLLLFGQ